MFRSCLIYADMIWNRRIDEYLLQNDVRAQWNRSEQNLQVADLVWLIEDNVKLSHNKMARVLQTYPGNDGVVRPFFIKKYNGTLKRPAKKLAPVFEERFQSYTGAGVVGASNLT